jgi:hypothetical protein
LSWPNWHELFLILLSLFSAFFILSEKTPAMPSVTLRFHVLTQVGCSWRFAAIYCTVLSPRSASRATAALE